MLPDFPRIKAKALRSLTLVMRQQAKDDPLLQIPRSEIHFEGNRFAQRDASGHLRASEYTAIDAKSVVNRADIINKGIFAFLEQNKKAAEDMKNQAAKMVIDTLGKITQQSGNIVDNGGKPFTFDSYIRALENVQIDFDDDGKPHQLSFVTHPDMAPKIKEVMEQALALPENRKRVDDLYARKRKEWNDRESNRKLVD